MPIFGHPIELPPNEPIWRSETRYEPMSGPKVVNLRSGEPYDVRIDRRTEWGNPYRIPLDGDRAEVVRKYRAWLMDNPARLQKARDQLRGKVLACWCAPLPCHGDALLEVANA